MKINKMVAIISLPVIFFIAGCNNAPTTQSDKPGIKEKIVTSMLDSVQLNNFVAYDSNKAGIRPGILVVHEWWGITDYIKDRVRQLADSGYIAIAVDMYGDGKVAATPDSAGKLAGLLYTHPQLAKNRFDAALNKLKAFPQTDTNNIAAIGYCFGGGMVLNVARMGEDVNGVVSFHGSLTGVTPEKDKTKAKVLVCHGGDDKFVTQQEVDLFKKQMDSVGADYRFIIYPGATHAFTNPDATASGIKFSIPIEYNAAADSTSWKDMLDFFGKIFK